ncbi:unnamed protein product [Schistosoma mattheei]|uniref:Uncharacterized protein n=1 Tax=Schistosoma mattheei TaxID=31246 RepID=A0A3P7XRM0_9TREM|nr:unnamed protein product [Schistosoma mattheei]
MAPVRLAFDSSPSKSPSTRLRLTGMLNGESRGAGVRLSLDSSPSNIFRYISIS